MFVQVKAYYNRESTYTPESITQIVGALGCDIENDTEDHEICEAVYALLNGAQPTTFLERRLSDVKRRYEAEGLRSMRPGDVITVWVTDDAYSYEVTDSGFRRIVRALSEV